MPSPLVGGLIISAVAYLTYLIFTFRDRAIGTTERKDPNFSEIQSRYPLLGRLPENIMNISRPLELCTIRGLERRPGWSITMPGLRLIDISKPEWIEYVQKTNFQNYVKGSLFQRVMADVFGNGIFVADGAVWKRTRHATSTIFTVHSFKTIMVPSVHTSLDSLTQVLSCAVETKQSLDICDIFFKFTLDTFVKMTFGKDLDLLRDTSKDSIYPNAHEFNRATSTAFVDAFDFAQKQLDFRFTLLTAWKIVEKLNFRISRRMKGACDILSDTIYSLIDERIAMFKQFGGKEQDGVHPDLLGLFMSARDERGGLGRTELRDAALNLIIAGRDTTAQALSWGFYHILMNKDVVSKIRQEKKEILANHADERVTHDNFKRFVWTQAVIHEALRLHPSVPKNLKFALKADTIPGGPKVEAGDAVRWSDWSMGRDPEIWGADCGEYRPERWIDESGRLKQFGQFKFHAFNGGPRVCLGMNLAIFEAVSVIVEVFDKFDLEFSPGWLENVPKTEGICGVTSAYPTPKYKPSLTLPMATPMMILVTARES